MPDKAPNFALLIGKRLEDKGKEGPDHSKEEGGEHEEMEKSAVADLLSALKSDDVEQARQALCDFLDLREQAPEEETQEPEAEE